MPNNIVRKVLWATDFSDMSVLALKATRFFRRMPSQVLCAVHTIDDPLDRMYKPEETSTVDMVDHARRVSEEKLKDMLAQIGIPAEQYKIIIKIGDAGEKILETAEEEEVRFIILGKESRGLERIMGSVSEFVLNNAKCPVLIVGNKVKGGWLKID